MKTALYALAWRALTYVKGKVDKTYYAHYHAANRESLIRKAFPGITKEFGYDRLNEFLREFDVSGMKSVIKVLMSFYWAEIARCQAEGKFQEAERYVGISEFCAALEAYSEEAKLLNNQA